MATATKLSPTRLKELWLLLLEDPMSLTDEQIEEFIAADDEIQPVRRRLVTFPDAYTTVRRYRRRKAELAQLSTEVLRQLNGNYWRDRDSVLAEDFADDLPDSFFEASRIDSDEHIIQELLKERGA